MLCAPCCCLLRAGWAQRYSTPTIPGLEMVGLSTDPKRCEESTMFLLVLELRLKPPTTHHPQVNTSSLQQLQQPGRGQLNI
jgi:hypothetical protein